jgi:hypothetical protein
MQPTTEAESAPQSDTSAATLVESDSDSKFDQQFIDNLVAADRFNTFLVGRGVEVPFDVSNGISELVSAFANDIAKAEAIMKEEGNLKHRSARVGLRRRSPQAAEIHSSSEADRSTKTRSGRS